MSMFDLCIFTMAVGLGILLIIMGVGLVIGLVARIRQHKHE